MKHLKLFESKNWEIVFDPHITRIEWNGLPSYLRDKTLIDFTQRDIKQIIGFLEHFVPMSMIKMPENTDKKLDYDQGKFRGSIDVSTERSSRPKNYYDNINILKLDDEYFIVYCTHGYPSGQRTQVFKCDQIEGLIELLGMMFEGYPKKDYSSQNYITKIKNLINSIDIEKTDPKKLKSLEEFLIKWKSDS